MPSWRLAAILCCTLALALALAACGGNDESTTTTTTTTTTSAKKTAAKEGHFPPFPAGSRFFSNDSPWNTTIDAVPADPASSQMLDLARRRVGTVEQPGLAPTTVSRVIRKGVALNTRAWAPVIVEVDRGNGVPTTLMCRQVDCGPGLQVPPSLPLPPGAQPDPRYDGWMSIIDRPNGIAYDLWRARRQDNGVITFQFSKAWALEGPGFSKPISVEPARAVGARGSGLPLFAGVIGPRELQAGQIDHALAISVPGLARRRYVQPASVTDGIGPTRALPAGARLRLKADVELPELETANRSEERARGVEETKKARRTEAAEETRHRYAEAILATLRRYGAIVVDRAAVPTLYGQYGALDNLVEGDELSWLHLDDFEVLSLPPIRLDPPAGKSAARAASVPRPATTGGGF